MKKNIILFLPDQHRGDYIPYREGCSFISMPNLRSMIEHGAIFDHCITPSPLCAPARACLAYGTDYRNCGVADNNHDMPSGRQTFYNHLRDGGYEVMGTGKFDVHKSTLFWGRDGWVPQLGELGFTKAIDNEGKIDCISATLGKGTVDSDREHERGPYLNFLYQHGMDKIHIQDFRKRQLEKFNTDTTPLDDRYYCDNYLTDNTLHLLSIRDRNKPFFMQINFTGPHGPYDVTENMARSMDERTYPKGVAIREGQEETNMKIKTRYVTMLENIDRNIGRIIEETKAQGVYENTIFIYASDHGEMLGDHGRYGKCVPYFGSVNIPMVIFDPQTNCRKEYDSLVCLQDLAATILDYAEVDADFHDSYSMKKIIDGKTESIRTEQVSALKDWVMVNDGKTKTFTGFGEKTMTFPSDDRIEITEE